MTTAWDALGLRIDMALGTPEDTVYDEGIYGQHVYSGQTDRPWIPVLCDVTTVTVTRDATRDPVMTILAEPGSMYLELHDPERRYDPDNQAGPHYGIIAPRLPIRITTSGGTVLARAYADSIGHNPAEQITSIVASGPGSILAAVPVVADTRPSETSVARIAHLHDVAAAGNIHCPPLVSTGAGIMLDPVTFDGDVLSAMVATAQADRALFYADQAGTVRYEADWNVIAGTPVARLGCPHRTDVDAHAHNWPTIIDRTLLVNQAVARGVGIDGETDQTGLAADAASVQRFGPSSQGAQVVLPLPKPALDAWAADAVRLHAWPTPRVSSLTATITGMEPEAAAELAVWWALDISDTIDWVYHDGATRRLAIIGVEHQIDTMGVYTGSLTLGRPLPVAGYNDTASRYEAVAYA